jgi:lipoyl(octanoyl) transferase
MSAPPHYPLDECLHVPGLPVSPGRAVYLGLVDYGEAWRLQLALVDAVLSGRAPDLLILCQHPDVITVGRRQRARDNILSPRFPTFEVERGGDATYHGPGQLVGYPIVKLRPNPPDLASPSERDLHRYLRALEGGLIDLCAALGIAAGRKPGATGVWTPPTPSQATRATDAGDHAGGDDGPAQSKLASMGIAVRRWITFHGFALNVSTDLARFSAINPCGFRAEVMTSLSRLCPQEHPPPTVEDLVPLAVEHLGARLARSFTLTAADWLDALRPGPPSA